MCRWCKNSSECEFGELSSNSSRVSYIHFCRNTLRNGINPSESYGLIRRKLANLKFSHKKLLQDQLRTQLQAIKKKLKNPFTNSWRFWGNQEESKSCISAPKPHDLWPCFVCFYSLIPKLWQLSVTRVSFFFLFLGGWTWGNWSHYQRFRNCLAAHAEG